MGATTDRIELLPPKLRNLFFRRGANGKPVFIPSRYKVAHGGRGSSKSWGFGTTALMLGSQRPLRILCVRETQNSIDESVKQLLTDRIGAMGLDDFFDVQAKVIKGTVVDTRFIFAGIRTDPGKIKSMERIDICLVEEAEAISEKSWKFLIPTIRGKGSEIWVVFNPRGEDDPTTKRFLTRMPPDCRRVRMNWYDNPWFPAELEVERQYALQLIRDAQARGDEDEVVQLQQEYDHVWEGDIERRSDAAIFRRRVAVESFPDPDERTRLFFGADWGFANDPTVLIRFWVTDHRDPTGKDYQELWISHEAFGYHVELDELDKLFDKVPGSRNWPIKADCARPETISYVSRHGFRASAAEKWPGSVEDGIAHLKAFRRIHIHTRCKHMQEEARLYSYKVDRLTGDVLPVIVDAYNHGWDAIRYGLDGYIQRRGVNGLWTKLAQ